MQEPHQAQSRPVQKRKRVFLRPRKKKIRQQTEGIRRTEEASLQEEGQGYQEDHFETRVLQVQTQEIPMHRKSQDLQIRGQEEDLMNYYKLLYF